MGEFRMPMLGADMEAGTLVEWLKHPGEPVTRGDIIAVVDTQKGAIEVEVFENGVLEKTLVEPGTQVPVGTVLAMIRSPGAATGTAAAAASPSPAPVRPAAAPAARPVSAPAAPTPLSGIDHVRSAPAARALARELGVDLARVRGTGPGGAITRADVEAARAAGAAPAAVPAPRPAPATPADPAAAMRAAIAAAMARSKREIPHYYLSTDVDLSAAMAWLRAENDRRPVNDRLLPVALFLKAVALALHDVPELNGFWMDGAFHPGAGIHIGCAIALRGGGLIAPALHDADHQDLGSLTRQTVDLVARARAGSLRSSEFTDPTITVTNLGDRGVDATFGVIYPPQVALVGFGRVADRAAVADGKVEVRPMVTVTLSADHRATDGHRGGMFLMAVDRRLQQPEAL